MLIPCREKISLLPHAPLVNSWSQILKAKKYINDSIILIDKMKPHLLSSASFPPRSGLLLVDIHMMWLCLASRRARKRSQPNIVKSVGTLPSGTWRYRACSSKDCGTKGKR